MNLLAVDEAALRLYDQQFWLDRDVNPQPKKSPYTAVFDHKYNSDRNSLQ